MFETCPTDIVDAPAERIWKLLVEPPLLDSWLDAKLVGGPGRTVAAGDVLRFTTGPAHFFKLKWIVGAMQPPKQLALRIELPFGLVNEEVIQISPTREGRCRVTFQ